MTKTEQIEYVTKDFEGLIESLETFKSEKDYESLQDVVFEIQHITNKAQTLMDDFWSDNQKQFIDDALQQGLEVDYSYSGRCMYGETCPSVRVDCVTELNSESNYKWDQMGLGYVLYCSH